MLTLLESKPLASKLWDKTKNSTPLESIDSNDDKEYYWTCKNHGHSFKMSPKNIPNDSRFCPFHTLLLIPGLNDLQTVDPSIASWFAEDLNGVPASRIRANSGKRFWWRDPRHHDHVWQSSLSNRRGQRSGCPICSGHVLLSGVNDIATMDPVESGMLDTEKNHGLTPDKIRYGSNAKIWWKCSRGHSFLKSPSWMRNNGGKCEQCEMEDTLSIAAMYPDLIPWFDDGCNKDSADHTPAKTMMKVHWRCFKGHAFTMRPYDIEHASHKCVRCYGKVKKRVVEGINDLASQRPDLLKRWAYDRNKDDPKTVRITSNKEYWWTCKEHPDHLFKCSVKRMSSLAKNQCPYCSGEETLVGFNDLFTMIPEFKGIWDYENNAIDPSTIRVQTRGTGAWCNNDDVLSWRCSKGHHWKCKISDLRRGNHKHCPYCLGKIMLPDHSNSIASDYPIVLKEWFSDKNGDPNNITTGSSIRSKIYWKCSNCGGIWKTRPFYYINNVSFKHDNNCPYCHDRELLTGLNDLATRRPDLIPMWSEKNDKGPGEYIFNSHEEVIWKCPAGHHREWRDSIRNEVNGGYTAGCYVCKNKVYSLGENDLATLRPDLVKEWAYDLNKTRPEDHMINDRTPIMWRCKNGHVWTCSISGRAFDHNGSCFRCASGLHTSEPENEITSYLRSILGHDEIIVNNDRKILGGPELDIYLPNRHVAIEYNGLYWHSVLVDNQFNKTRHYEKYTSCKQLGIRLIQIWEDQWLDHPDIVKDSLRAILKPETMIKENARSLHVEEPERSYAQKFLDENHIQGHAGGCSYLALVDDHHMIKACMAYRVNDSEFNLVRYASELGHNVRGGLSKLLKHSISIVNKDDKRVDHVVTFSDNTISEGASYEKIGFHIDKEIPPDYSYVSGKHRFHKFLYRKKRFRDDPDLKYDPTAHESELAEMNGLNRIYDAGKIRWRMNV